jgi:hypothetical protein
MMMVAASMLWVQAEADLANPRARLAKARRQPWLSQSALRALAASCAMDVGAVDFDGLSGDDDDVDLDLAEFYDEEAMDVTDEQRALLVSFESIPTRFLQEA